MQSLFNLKQNFSSRDSVFGHLLQKDAEKSQFLLEIAEITKETGKFK